MHLRQLELSLRADTARERGVADHVAESLSAEEDRVRIYVSIPRFPQLRISILGQARTSKRRTGFVPFGLSLLEGHALVVVPNQAGINKPRKIKLLGPEKACHFGHFGVFNWG